VTHYENKLQLFTASCPFTILLCDLVNHFTYISPFIAGDVCTCCNLYVHYLLCVSTFLDIIYTETSLSLFFNEDGVRGFIRLLREPRRIHFMLHEYYITSPALTYLCFSWTLKNYAKSCETNFGSIVFSKDIVDEVSGKSKRKLKYWNRNVKII